MDGVSDQAFLVILALVFGPLAALVVVSTLLHSRRWRRSTLRTQGWVVARPPFDDEADSETVTMHWYAGGALRQGPVRLKVRDLAERDRFDLRVDPREPDRALAESNRPAPIAFVLGLVFAGASLVVLTAALVRALGVHLPGLGRLDAGAGWIVGGAFGVFLAAGLAGAAVYVVVTLVGHLVRATRDLGAGRPKAALGAVATAVGLAAFVVLVVLFTASS